MNERILVGDDERDIADLLEIYLTNDGFSVHKCYDGSSALAWVETNGADLALLDVMLPGMDGFQLVRAIRREHFFPIIMLTARLADQDKITGLTLGADGGGRQKNVRFRGE